MQMHSKKLSGTWYHSSEEDRGDLVVYRGPSYAFPPARMARNTLTFSEDGRAEVGRPGPADASVSTVVTWLVDDDSLKISAPGREDVFTIESADEDVLVLRRQQSKEVSDGAQE